MPEFAFAELLQLGPDTTDYRLLTTDGVSTVDTAVGAFLRVEPEALTLITETAMRDIAHLLRPAHLQQLRNILDDPEASDNDRFVALDLLKNANIAAGGVLPMCQDTGTAIVKAKKGQYLLTAGGDEGAIARGVFNTYLTSNLRYSQMAPLTMYEECNTGNNLPAEIKIAAVDGDSYKFLFIAKGGGSANKSYLFQETKALLNEKTLLPWLFDKMKTLGTSACPPYHLAVVIGGTSAEFAVEPKLSQGTGSFVEYGWTASPDAWNSLNGLFRTFDRSGLGTFNAGRYSNAKLDVLIDNIRTEPDLTRRRAMVATVLRLVADELPMVPLYRRTLTWAMVKKVSVAQWPNDTMELRFVKVK